MYNLRYAAVVLASCFAIPAFTMSAATQTRSVQTILPAPAARSHRPAALADSHVSVSTTALPKRLVLFNPGGECEDGQSCDDGNACTTDDFCTDGTCAGLPMDCSGAGDQCNIATCDLNGSDGNCDILTPRKEGTPCDAGPCSSDESCMQGVCGGTPVDCSGAGDQCNTASCDSNGKDGNCAILTPSKNGDPCNDDDACTSDDSCTEGQCGGTPVDCSDAGDECNTASCDSNGKDGNCAILTPNKNGDPCNDGDACTTDDSCTEGQCGGTPVDCSSAGGQCNIATCDLNGADGNCAILTPVKGGTPCDDESACTQDACTDGTCIGTPIECNDQDACTTDGCDPENGCTTEPIICNDGDACTTDGCDPENGCTTEPIVCNDGDACTTDGCDPESGCTTEPIICNDGDACTTDGCDPESGCTTEPIICNDGDACTTDGCDPESGCTTEPIECNDENECTTDTCDTETGCAYEPVECVDDDPCTVDVCDPEDGCTHEPVECPEGAMCVDGECVAECTRTLIIMQGACPAPVNPNANGVVPMLLVGELDFAAESAVHSSLKLRICGDTDGPHIVPLGRHIKVKDLNHPFEGTTECGGCTCNPDQRSDGIDDLSLKFRQNEFADVLGLLPGGDVITVELTGVLEDGTPFCARDCIRLVPEGH